MRTKAEIEAELARIEDAQESSWPQLTYEQGVENSLNWVIEATDDAPMDD